MLFPVLQLEWNVLKASGVKVDRPSIYVCTCFAHASADANHSSCAVSLRDLWRNEVTLTVSLDARRKLDSTLNRGPGPGPDMINKHKMKEEEEEEETGNSSGSYS